MRRVSTGALTLLFAWAFTFPASAQYFGQNKVQYHSLKFEVLETEHFDIYHYRSERRGVDIAARLSERWHARLERIFAHRLSARQPLILYGSHAEFEQTNVISGLLTEGIGGATEPLRRRIVLPLAGPIAETDHVLGHELVHAFQFDITTRPDMGPGVNAAQRLPLWFIEGMAEYLAIGPVDATTAMWLRDAARHDRVPAVKDLDDPEYFPYRWGHAFWAYVGGRWGDAVIAPMLETAAFGGNIDGAMRAVLGVSAAELSNDWHASIRKTYAAALETAPPPLGRRLIAGTDLGGDLNVGPALSPDGRWMAFISQRGLFAADLFIADAATGHVVRRLTSTATDPHYSSIQFIYSAGAWDHQSRRIALATVVSGHPALAIFDALKGRKERDFVIEDVDEILNPSWAPDGQAIAFTGMKQGLTDLFIYDLATATVRQLTDDAYADLQPAWSPDGARLAFATDRYSTSLRTLATGPYQLAILDPVSGTLDSVPALRDAATLGPQWSPDGRALYFVADHGGVRNVFRVSLDTGELTQVTATGSGVSGITAGSPALSVARLEGTIAFSVYEDGKYDIYTLDRSAARGQPPTGGQGSAAVLPPADRARGEVAGLLADATFGLPEPLYQATPYKPKLSLEAAGQSMVGAGIGRFGPTISGGVSLYFGDQLENRVLATAVGLNTSFNGRMSWKDIAGAAVYLDRERRWNWGVMGAQVPYLSSGYQSAIWDAPNGDLLQTDQLITFRQTEQSVSGITAYPFDRARRIELQAGATHMSYEQIVDTATYSLITGRVYEETSQTTSLAQSLTLGTSSAAYVFDASSFGATGPVYGHRYRIEASPTFGTLNFTGVLADFRRYFMPVPFYTVAARVMHYGRYGQGSEDPRLYPIDIGYPGLIRGYDSTSINAWECLPTPASSCPVYDRLLGSRMLVGNVELRFPLLRPFGLSRSMYGPVPVEVAVFADSGVAWTSAETPELFGGSRDGIWSAGVSFRVNMFGFAVGQFDASRPFQRPGLGWTFAFNLLPGW